MRVVGDGEQGRQCFLSPLGVPCCKQGENVQQNDDSATDSPHRYTQSLHVKSIMSVAACSPGCDTSAPVVIRGTRSWRGISKHEAHHSSFTYTVAHPGKQTKETIVLTFPPGEDRFDMKSKTPFVIGIVDHLGVNTPALSLLNHECLTVEASQNIEVSMLFYQHNINMLSRER
jgi:hypothetical protein